MKVFLAQWHSLFVRACSPEALPRRTWTILLLAILVGALAVRLWTINAPALDRTDWKEIDHIAISSNYWHHGFNFLRPEIEWPAEPPRATAMELPAVPYLAACLYTVMGYNVYSVRLIPLLAYLLQVFYVFRLAKREIGPIVGLLAALACAIMPLYHIFGRILFSEPVMVAASVASLFYWAEWFDRRTIANFCLAWGCFSLAVALKLEPLYLLLPLAWITFRTNRWNIKAYGLPALGFLLSLVLPAAWFSYAFYLKKTSLDVFGVFPFLEGHNKLDTLSMLSNPKWHRIMFDRFSVGILGGAVGSSLFGLGVVVGVWRKVGGLFFAYLLAIVSHVVIVAEGQRDTAYRQLHAVPILAVFVALGAVGLLVTLVSLAWSLRPSRAARMALGMTIVVALGVGIALMLGVLKATPSQTKILIVVSLAITIVAACLVLGHRPVSMDETERWPHWLFVGFGLMLVFLVVVQQFGEVLPHDPTQARDPRRWELAEQIKRRAGSDAKLVTVGEYTIHHGGNDLSPVLYYYCGLQGWTLAKKDWNVEFLDSLIRKGATHFVCVSPKDEPECATFIHELQDRYSPLFQDADAVVLDLGNKVNSK
jgi:4-amino-4-deoxy-L-arabinose transferase-like glycosyltransferase